MSSINTRISEKLKTVIMSFYSKLIRLVQSLRKQTVIKADIKFLAPSKMLEHKRIIITGGSRGLGYAMAKKFVAEGAEVLITGHNIERLKQASEEIGCKYVLFDSTDFDKMDSFIDEARNALGQIDVLINNAGISLHEGNIRNVTKESYDVQFDTNLKSAYFLSQKFLEIYEGNHQRNGSILFVSSERGKYVDDIPYGLIKASINSLTQGLSFLLRKSDIRINAIAPGITATDMTGTTPENLFSGKYATGRYYLPEEVAEVACFLVSDVSKCVSGQIIGCDNGYNVNSYRK